MRFPDDRPARDDGYAMAILLIAIAVMGIMLSVAMPVWRTVIQREREEELIFRGKQYTRAIGLFQRRFANAYPPSIDVLVEQKLLRKKYKDPVNADGEFEPVYQNSPLAVGTSGRAGQTGRATTTGRGQSAFGQPATQTGFTTTTSPPGGRAAAGPQGNVVGVVSKSKDESIKIYDGHTHYNEWLFIYIPAQQPGRGGGANVPGGRGGRGPGQGQGQNPGGFGPPGGMGPGRGQGGPGRGPGRSGTG
jgi:type II secretory pathway pseudopilin PulG